MMSRYPTMDWSAQNLAETFHLFKQRMNLVCDDEGVMDPRKRAVKIQIAVGNEGLQNINS